MLVLFAEQTGSVGFILDWAKGSVSILCVLQQVTQLSVYICIYVLSHNKSSTELMLSVNVWKGLKMSRLVGKPTMWFPNRSDTNRPVQLQKQAR